MFRILCLFRKLPFNILSFGNRKVIFAEYFKGFEKVEAVEGIFGEKTVEVRSIDPSSIFPTAICYFAMAFSPSMRLIIL